MCAAQSPQGNLRWFDALAQFAISQALISFVRWKCAHAYPRMSVTTVVYLDKLLFLVWPDVPLLITAIELFRSFGCNVVEGQRKHPQQKDSWLQVCRRVLRPNGENYNLGMMNQSFLGAHTSNMAVMGALCVCTFRLTV